MPLFGQAASVLLFELLQLQGEGTAESDVDPGSERGYSGRVALAVMMEEQIRVR